MTKCCCYIFQFLCSLARYKERKRDQTFKLLKIFQWVQALHLSLVRKSFINLNDSLMSRCCYTAAAEMLWKNCPNMFNQKRRRSLTILQSNIFGQFWLLWALSIYYLLSTNFRYFKILFFKIADWGNQNPVNEL